MGKTIGIYGGSFDPPHNGHLNLAVQIMEAHQLDEVWFCPAALNPLKTQPLSASAAHRLNMLRLAIEGEPRFKVSDIDLNREPPSYTIDTLHALKAMQTPEIDPVTFSLILGEDAARGFYRWRQPEEIIRCANLLVGRRNDGAGMETPFEGDSRVVAALNKGLTPTAIMDISSTEVRGRLKNGLFCGHLMPGKVLDYIFSHHLYSELMEETRFL